MSDSRFEDDRDHPTPTPRGVGPIILLLAAGAVTVVLVCAGGAAWLLWFQRQRDVRAADERIAAAVRAEQVRLAGEKGAPEREVGPAPRVVGGRQLGRREFDAAVRGKSRDQIVAAVGPPEDVRERVYVEERPPGPRNRVHGWFADWLVFRNRVTDDATGAVYAEVRVRIGPDGKADRIEYP